MAYQLPTFPLLAAIWDGMSLPTGGPADHTGVPVQKYITPRPSVDLSPQQGGTGWWLEYVPAIFIRFPLTSPFNVNRGLWLASIWEIPEGDGLYYRTRWFEIIHEGFSNQYGVALVEQCMDDGTTVPPPRP